jgi:hypothetical protein
MKKWAPVKTRGQAFNHHNNLIIFLFPCHAIESVHPQDGHAVHLYEIFTDATQIMVIIWVLTPDADLKGRGMLPAKRAHPAGRPSIGKKSPCGICWEPSLF